ncbi:Hypothetical_protein [Hexamita inflata]|uniref:Hypothetical_protein n=1 Tax=Hexamita inflata TaxID=28002 RepID=A0AA86U3J2_9EUKA|nr:Hypothetical protein HINF_LOCUS24317 [Hexamita inflata]
MRLGQIGCGRQNPPIQSAELASSRIGQGHAINEPSGLESGNRSIASLETQMDSRIDRLARSSRVTHGYILITTQARLLLLLKYQLSSFALSVDPVTLLPLLEQWCVLQNSPIMICTLCYVHYKIQKRFKR